MLLEDFPVEEAFFGKRPGKIICFAFFLKFRIRVKTVGIFLQVIYHGMADCVGKCSLLSPEDGIWQKPVFLKSLSQQIFTHAVSVDFQSRVDRHDIFYKFQIPEGYTSLQRVDGDASVSPQNIIHIDFINPLFCLLLECLGRRCKIGILIAEQLVADLACHKHTNVCLLMDGFAAQIHSHACPDSCDIIGAQHGNDLFQGIQYLLAGHINFRVLCTDIRSGKSGIFKVNGISIHPDGKSPHMPAEYS